MKEIGTRKKKRTRRLWVYVGACEREKERKGTYRLEAEQLQTAAKMLRPRGHLAKCQPLELAKAACVRATEKVSTESQKKYFGSFCVCRQLWQCGMLVNGDIPSARRARRPKQGRWL